MTSLLPAAEGVCLGARANRLWEDFLFSCRFLTVERLQRDKLLHEQRQGAEIYVTICIEGAWPFGEKQGRQVSVRGCGTCQTWTC